MRACWHHPENWYHTHPETASLQVDGALRRAMTLRRSRLTLRLVGEPLRLPPEPIPTSPSAPFALHLHNPQPAAGNPQTTHNRYTNLSPTLQRCNHPPAPLPPRETFCGRGSFPGPPPRNRPRSGAPQIPVTGAVGCPMKKLPLFTTALLSAATFTFTQGLVAALTPTPSPTVASAAANVAAYNGFLLGSVITGSHIKNFQGQDIGTIKDLVINPDTGHVRFAVLSVGGFLGLGDTEVIAPWGAVGLEKNAPGKEPSYVINATKDKLEKAPRFDGSKLTQLYTKTMAQPIFDYYEIVYFDDVAAPSASPSPAASPTPKP